MTEMNFPTIDIKATGEHIRQLRIENRLTVKDMQKFFNFEYPQTIYKWQWGICLPSIDNFVGLWVYIGVRHPYNPTKKENCCSGR